MCVEIVVPIYNAFSSFSSCLASLKKYNQDDVIIFINDASTDERIRLILDEIDNPNWQIITNEVNLGFVKTANIGLKRQPGHTVLLNSDTIVTQGWLTSLLKCVDLNPQVATVTPWSNNAEICSFPETLTNNHIPKKPDRLAEFLSSHWQPGYPQLPTAVGFCMLVSQKAKQEVGYFDENCFGFGYGEENDYSLRAKSLGMSNLLCDNAYVIHVGNQSFQDKNLAPDSETMNRLLKKHPYYQQLIESFIQRDPLASLRTALIDKIALVDPELLECFYE